VYESLTAAHDRGHLPPTDASRGSRYCEVDDADGHPVGFTALDDAKKERAPQSL